MKPRQLSVINGSGSGRYKPGTVVSISANRPPVGKVFSKWTGFAVASSTSASTTLVMPSKNVSVTATYEVAVVPPPVPPPAPPTVYTRPWPAESDGLQNATGVMFWQGEPWAVVKSGWRNVQLVNMITGATRDTDPQVIAPPGPTLCGAGGAHALADGRVVICWHEFLAVFNADWTFARKVLLPYSVSYRKPVTSGVVIGSELLLVRETSRANTCSWTVKVIAVNLDTGLIREGSATTCTATLGCLAGYGAGGWGDLVRSASGVYVFGNSTNGSGQMFYARIDPVTLSLTLTMVWQNVNYHGPIPLPVTDGVQVACPGTTSSGIPCAVVTTDFVSKKLLSVRDWQQPVAGVLPDVRVVITPKGTILLTLHGSSRITGEVADYLLWYDGAQFQQLDKVPFVTATSKPYSWSLTVNNGLIYWLGPGGATGEPLQLHVHADPR